MDKKEKKALRMELNRLLENHSENAQRIGEIGRLLSGKPAKVAIPIIEFAAIYIELRNEGLKRPEIAAKLDLTIKELEGKISYAKKKDLIPKGAIEVKGASKKFMTKEEYLTCGLTDKEVREKYKISSCTLLSKKREWGLTIRKKVQYDLTYEEYCSYKGQLLTDKEISEMIGWSRNTLHLRKKKWAAQGKRVFIGKVPTGIIQKNV